MAGVSNAVKRMTSGSLAVILAFAVSLAQGVDPDAIKRRALALAQAGDYAQARADLERLVSAWPDDRLARKLLARVLIAANATSDAATHLERLVRTDGTEAEAQARRAAAIDPAHPLVRDALRALERRPAVMTRRSLPAPAETLPAPRFVDIAAEAGVAFTLRNSPTPEKHQIETMPGGVAVLDYDRDGLMDIYFTNGAESPSLRRSGPDDWNRLYRNLGHGR